MPFEENFNLAEEKIFLGPQTGYWSNLDKVENQEMISRLKSSCCQDVIKNHYPQYDEIIFSPKRQAGLELLNLHGDEIGIDYGCMWGALTVPLAKRIKKVFSVDQTLQSLQFLKERLCEEKLNNVSLICCDLKTLPPFKKDDCPDIAIVNGVLEWIPEEGHIELKSYWGKKNHRTVTAGPMQQQLQFLKYVYENLSDRGKLYLAIENRYDLKMFLGAPDPHAGIPFVSLLPRILANFISKIFLKRPYVNWIYSFNEIRQLLTQKTGFSKVDLYLCFPNYRYPQRIIPLDHQRKKLPLTPIRNIKGKIEIKRIILCAAEVIFFRVLHIYTMAPSIIAIGHK